MLKPIFVLLITYMNRRSCVSKGSYLACIHIKLSLILTYPMPECIPCLLCFYCKAYFYQVCRFPGGASKIF